MLLTQTLYRIHEKRAEELVTIKPDPKVADEDEREYLVYE
jgi:hypothetical protein